MPIQLNCPGCGKQLRVRDELAGKRARCPACGAVVAVPSPITRKPALTEIQRTRPHPVVEEEEPEELPPEEEAPRRRKKRRRRSKAILFTPLLTLFGVNLTPLKLMILGVVFLGAGLGAYLYVTAAEAKVTVVDVFNIDEDMHEFTPGGLDIPLMRLFRKRNPTALVVKENSGGAFLMVRFKLSERTVKRLVGDDYANFIMKKKDVVLQGEGEPIYPLFLFDVKATNYEIKRKSVLGDDDDERKREPQEPAGEAHQKNVAPNEENPWTHEGTLQVNPTGPSEFRGIRGMVVTYAHGPLPAKEVTVTWDKSSAFWFGVKEAEVPSELFLYDWRVTCLFPRPTSTKGLKLTVLGKNLKMNYP